MKILYAGSSQSSAEILQALINDNHEIVGVLSQPDKRSRRSKGLEPSHVSAVAEVASIKVYKPFKLDEDFKEKILSLDFDLLLVVAYGKILPKWLLESSTKISVNIHFSLLPKYRGASPIQSCLLKGDLNTGISIMEMTSGLDEGPIYNSEQITISDNADKNLLEEELTKVAKNILFGSLLDISQNKKLPTAQDDSGASYCKKITKSSGKINFLEEDADSIIRKFNAYKGWPGIFFEKDNVIIKIHGIKPFTKIQGLHESSDFYFSPEGLAVKTSTKLIVITHLQFPGKTVITSQDAANSYAEFFTNSRTICCSSNCFKRRLIYTYENFNSWGWTSW